MRPKVIKTAGAAAINRGGGVMRKPARSLFQLFAGIVACANLSSFDSLAQGYPIEPIRLISGFTAGSAPDTLARTFTPALSENLGQPVVVENRGGAGGSIATEMKTALNKQGLDPQTNTPEQFAAFIRREIAQNAKLIKLFGAKTE
jgi:tripartite-type tricarboxylate transporter receptor subunit TctC